MSTAPLRKEFMRLIEGLSGDDLEQILAFVRFVRQNERSAGSGEKSYSLDRLGEMQAVHLEEEFEDYRKKHPIE